LEKLAGETLTNIIKRFHSTLETKRQAEWSLVSVSKQTFDYQLGTIASFARTLQMPGDLAEALCWAYLLPRIPDDMKTARTRLAYERLWENWLSLWQFVLQHAQSPKQMALAEDLLEAAKGCRERFMWAFSIGEGAIFAIL
jgi:hypothetical protein